MQDPEAVGAAEVSIINSCVVLNTGPTLKLSITGMAHPRHSSWSLNVENELQEISHGPDTTA